MGRDRPTADAYHFTMLRRLAACAFALGGIAVACGLDVVGLAPTSVADASAPDASEPAGDDDTSSPVDAALDAMIDAGPKCGSIRVTDALTAILGDGGDGWFITHDSSNGDHPKVDPADGGPAFTFVTPAALSSVGGLWRAPLALHAFDVSFRYIATCNGACSDGIAAIWLESRDGGVAELNAPTSADSFAIPPGARGTAIALDVRTDTVATDPPTPSLSIFTIDPTKTPGTYDWHAKSTAADAGYLGEHTVTLQVRQNVVAVKLDGAPALTASIATTDFTGWFGLGASVASDPGTFAARDFDATFYDCDDP